MNKNTEKLVINAIEEIIPKIETYREKNITKYNAESNLEYGGEYSVLEKYKNRVRVVDIFLPSLKKLVDSYYSVSNKKDNRELD